MCYNLLQAFYSVSVLLVLSGATFYVWACAVFLQKILNKIGRKGCGAATVDFLLILYSSWKKSFFAAAAWELVSYCTYT